MTTPIDAYRTFVETLTSTPSKDFDAYVARLKELHDAGCNISLLDAAATGLNAEAGEALEIVKKLKFQEKPWNDDTKFHLLREAGDAIFYWIMLTLALGQDPYEVIGENIRKLESRYPGGKFDGFYSENRAEGDL